MRYELKKIWYCEFCGKHYHRCNQRHEDHCTANPDRSCGICARPPEFIHLRDIVAKAKAETETHEDEDVDVDGYSGDKWVTIRVVKCPTLLSIQDAVEGCPACTLAVLRQAGLCGYIFADHINFKYKEAKAQWWADQAKEIQRSDMI